MVSINIKFSNKTLYLLIGILTLLAAAGVAIATDPNVHGHELIEGVLKINRDPTYYDVWIQGGLADSGETRNLALLGIKNGDILMINHDGEYTGGTRIMGDKFVVDGEIIGKGTENILNSGSGGSGGSQVVLRKDGANAYLWPWGTGTSANEVVVGGPVLTNFKVSGNLQVDGTCTGCGGSTTLGQNSCAWHCLGDCGANNGGVDSYTCPVGQYVAGTRWLKQPDKIDDEYIEIYCCTP
tara:strand:- start:68 stop:784 length:717 start_codon:yes stop_codon:yes gene_type:complete